MKKAILVGNGFSSQLIENYKNKIMLKNFEKQAPIISKKIKSKYKLLHDLRVTTFDKSDFKDKVFNLVEQLHDKNSLDSIYNYTMIDSGFYEELIEPSIYGIESIMKVAKLFAFNNLSEIEDKAIDICFNDGLNGVNGITATNKININKTKKYFQEFDYVFTTNYDYLLDDLYNDEVKHIHGGFDYYKTYYKRNNATEVKKYDARIDDFNDSKYNNKELDKIVKPFLIWGSSGKEKESQMGGGFTFPITFPLFMPGSLVRKHIEKLMSEEISEIHLFGYSGFNDSHINNAIKLNQCIEKVIFYCNPSLTKSSDKYSNISNIFKSDKATLQLKSWDCIWNELK